MVIHILILNICSVLASIPFTSPPIDDDNDLDDDREATVCLQNLVLFVFDNVELVCTLSLLFLLVVRQSQDSPEAVVQQSCDSHATVMRQ